jgi:hypothetical protein
MSIKPAVVILFDNSRKDRVNYLKQRLNENLYIQASAIAYRCHLKHLCKKDGKYKRDLFMSILDDFLKKEDDSLDFKLFKRDISKFKSKEKFKHESVLFSKSIEKTESKLYECLLN